MNSKAPPSSLSHRVALSKIHAARTAADNEAHEAIRRATPASMRPTTHASAAPAPTAPQLPMEYRIGPGPRPGPIIGLLLLAFFVAAAGLVALAGANERRTIATPATEWRDR